MSAPTASGATLRELAKVVRSKNAGPFALTFDVVFSDRATYERVKGAGILDAALIARLYGLSPQQVLVAAFFDPAMAFKATIVRPTDSGGPDERDTYGGQQAAPLLDVWIPHGGSR